MRSIIAGFLTIILPGTGHILVRKYLKGVVLGTLFAACANVFLADRYLLVFAPSSALPWVALGLAAAVWVWALVDLEIGLKRKRAKDFQSGKDELLKAAQVAWLRDDLGEAERLLRAILSRDERDIEAWVHLGKVLKTRGRRVEAQVCFRSALNLDGASSWSYMLREELAAPAPEKVKSAATA